MLAVTAGAIVKKTLGFVPRPLVRSLIDDLLVDLCVPWRIVTSCFPVPARAAR